MNRDAMIRRRIRILSRWLAIALTIATIFLLCFRGPWWLPTAMATYGFFGICHLISTYERDIARAGKL